ncbi:MAG: hypothetical protein K2P93_06185 [Alphaproteobacteria bacterium]|nr:hypothetical protein [Alphaproteobacteria bacterium]
MYFKKSRSFFNILLLFFVLSTQPLSSAPHLWDAIEAFERGDDERARSLFKSFLKGNPIARHYCRHLNIEDETFHEDLREFSLYAVAKGWFNVSLVLREMNEIDQQFQRTDSPKEKAKLQKRKKKLWHERLFKSELEKKKNPAAGFALGKLAERGDTIGCIPGSREIEKTSYLVSSQLLPGSKMICDPRSLIAMRNRGIIIKADEQDLTNIIKILEGHLCKSSVEESLFKLSQLFEGKNPYLRTYFLRSAALHGCLNAQKKASSFCDNEQDILYWILQACESNDVLSLESAACFFEEGRGTQSDFQKSFFYSERAMRAADPDNPAHSPIFGNYAIRLKKGWGGKADPEEIKKYFQIAAKFNDVKAKRDYGIHLIEDDETEEGKSIIFDCAVQGDIPSLKKCYELSSHPDECLPLIPVCLQLGERFQEEEKGIWDEATTSLDEIASLAFMMALKAGLHVVQHYKERFFYFLDKFDGMASHYLRGVLLRDYNEDGILKGDSFGHFLIAEKLGSKLAAYEIGICYEYGKGISRDLDQALLAYKRSIKKGILNGLNNAGVLLMNKENSKDDYRAVHYFQRSYREETLNRCLSAFNLALMHVQGRGGAKKELNKVEYLFREAMEDPTLKLEAAHELARFVMLQTEDYKKARDLLLEGVEKRNPDSLLYMGQAILLDQNLSKDRGELIKGVDCIQKAFDLNARFSRPLFAFILTCGIKDVLECDVIKAKDIISQLSEDERNLYLQLIMAISRTFEAPLLSHLSPQPAEAVGITEQEVEEIQVLSSAEKPIEVVPVKEEPCSGFAPFEEEKSITLERAQRKLEALLGKKGKKQIKWRKVKSIMGRFIKLTSGSVKPVSGGGSGHKVEVAGNMATLHIPHGKGKDPTELKGGRLKSISEALKKASKKSSGNPEDKGK